MKPQQRILLAMSGGTDSSVAAILLLEQGFDVEGVTFMTWGESPAFVDDAAELARQLGIMHHVVDIRHRFEEKVIRYFLDEYQNGRTPNPCIVCNPLIKWATLASNADELGIQWLATGHYASVIHKDGSYFISKGKDKAKDQSYFLWRLPQNILNRACFPLGMMTKTEVRQIAVANGFKSVAHKKESMGVCFLEGSDVGSFLEQHRPDILKSGVIVSEQGEVLGHHNGVAFYTIGQKKGLDVTSMKGQCVVKIDAERNRLLVGNPESLWCENIVLDNYELVGETVIDHSKTYQVRIRGIDRVPYHEASIEINHNQLVIRFHQPVWAPTPGQSVVISDNELVLGGGIID
jgi:tRNA-uridine 2-sulfurtransferase